MEPKSQSIKSTLPPLVLAIVTVFLTVFIYFFAQTLAVLILGVVSALTGGSREQLIAWLETDTTGRFTVYFLVSVIGICLVFLTLKMLQISRQKIGLLRPKIRDIGYALGGYIAYFLLYIVISILIRAFGPEVDFSQDQQLGFQIGVAGPELALIFVSLVVLPPIYEEILTRGFLYTGLRAKLSILPAAVVTSVIFATAHLQWGSGAPLLWAAAVDTFVLSLVLVWLREKTGSLWPAIGLHAIKNAIAFFVIFVIGI